MPFRGCVAGTILCAIPRVIRKYGSFIQRRRETKQTNQLQQLVKKANIKDTIQGNLYLVNCTGNKARHIRVLIERYSKTTRERWRCLNGRKCRLTNIRLSLETKTSLCLIIGDSFPDPHYIRVPMGHERTNYNGRFRSSYVSEETKVQGIRLVGYLELQDRIEFRHSGYGNVHMSHILQVTKQECFALIESACDNIFCIFYG